MLLTNFEIASFRLDYFYFIVHFSTLLWKGVVLTDFPNDAPPGD